MTHETEILPPGAELVAIPRDKAIDYFMETTAIEPILAKVREEIDKWESPGVDTAAAREAIKVFAFKIVKSRTYLSGIGDELAAEAKALPKKIDATRKHIKDTLERWQNEVRKPLTDWEEAEAARIKTHRDALDYIAFCEGSSHNGIPFSAEQLRIHLSTVEGMEINAKICGEFITEYHIAQEHAAGVIRNLITSREKDEADAAELAKLRADAAVRERQDEIKREAEAQIAAERRRIAAAIDSEQRRAKEDTDRLQREHQQEIAAFERATQEAEERSTAISQRMIREATEAKERERAEAVAREADKKHRGAVNRAAVAAFMQGGIRPENAKIVVELIAKHMIPACRLEY